MAGLGLGCPCFAWKAGRPFESSPRNNQSEHVERDLTGGLMFDELGYYPNVDAAKFNRGRN